MIGLCLIGIVPRTSIGGTIAYVTSSPVSVTNTFEGVTSGEPDIPEEPDKPTEPETPEEPDVPEQQAPDEISQTEGINSGDTEDITDTENDSAAENVVSETEGITPVSVEETESAATGDNHDLLCVYISMAALVLIITLRVYRKRRQDYKE